MKGVRNVFLKYGLGAKRLSEIWFGCETVFLKYGLCAKRLSKIWFGCETSWGETSFLFMGRGRNVFPRYELGAKRLTKKWCELTMGRKVCVPLYRA